MKLGQGGASEEEMMDYFQRLSNDCEGRYQISGKAIGHWMILGGSTGRPYRSYGTTLYYSIIIASLILLMLTMLDEVWWLAVVMFVIFVLTMFQWIRSEARLSRIRYWTEPALVKRYPVPFSDSVLRVHQGLTFRREDIVVFDVSADREGDRLRGTIFQVLRIKVLVTLWQQGGDHGHTTVHICPSTTRNSEDVNHLRSLVDGHLPDP